MDLVHLKLKESYNKGPRQYWRGRKLNKSLVLRERGNHMHRRLLILATKRQEVGLMSYYYCNYFTIYMKIVLFEPISEFRGE